MACLGPNLKKICDKLENGKLLQILRNLPDFVLIFAIAKSQNPEGTEKSNSGNMVHNIRLELCVHNFSINWLGIGIAFFAI